MDWNFIKNDCRGIRTLNQWFWGPPRYRCAIQSIQNKPLNLYIKIMTLNNSYSSCKVSFWLVQNWVSFLISMIMLYILVLLSSLIWLCWLSRNVATSVSISFWTKLSCYLCLDSIDSLILATVFLSSSTEFKIAS